jgi:surface carbohydrate biosynthesis protein
MRNSRIAPGSATGAKKVKIAEDRVVYILIEKKNREFMSKMLVASELLKRGVPVVIGFYTSVLINLPVWPRGIVYTKGLNRVQYDLLEALPAMRHLVVATDEEALGSSDPNFIVQDTWPAMSKVTDMVFCQGEIHHRALIELREFKEEQTVITGNPRIDLLRHPAAERLKAKAAAIRDRHGSFVLINTDCGFVNNRVRNRDEFHELLEKIGWIDPNSQVDQEMVADVFQNDEDNLRAIEGFIRSMEKARPDRHIILRPHPAERMEIWRSIERTVKNLKVIEGTEAPEWILAADCLIQTGCTTGVEAAILGTPTIGLVCHPTPIKMPGYLLTNQINPIARSIDDAIVAIRDLENDPNGPIGARFEEKRIALKPHLDVDPDRSAFQKIADVLLKMLPVDGPAPRSSVFDFSNDSNSILKKSVKLELFNDAHFALTEVEDRLSEIAEFRSIPVPGTVRDLGWGAYLLQPTAN